MCIKCLGREQDPFYSPDIDYEVAALVLLPPSNGPGWG